LIDDDERLGSLLSRFVERFGITLESVTVPSAAFARLTRGGIDLVVLDVMLPEMDGFEVCRTLRKTSDIPIIMLTARGDVMDRVVGLELGADDYLPKPFEPRELVARAQNILKRSARTVTASSRLNFEHLILDPLTHEVWVDGAPTDLTSTEFALLLLLVRSPGQVFSRDAILNHLKGIDAELFSRAVDISISRLRGKLKPHEFIRTVRSSGYCFVGKAL
jgi:OmpR family response regulator RpaB